MPSLPASRFIPVCCSKAFRNDSRGALTDKQHAGVILRLHYLALLQWGLWESFVPDNGSQFRSGAFGRWKIYIEEGLPKTPVKLIYWDGKLRAEYRQTKLAKYDCRWDDKDKRPKTIEKPLYFETPYSSNQPELFEVGWYREPIEEIRAERKSFRSGVSNQLKLTFSEAA